MPFFTPPTISTICLPTPPDFEVIDTRPTSNLLPSTPEKEMVDKLVDGREWQKSAKNRPFLPFLPSTFIKEKNKKRGGERRKESGGELVDRQIPRKEPFNGRETKPLGRHLDLFCRAKSMGCCTAPSTQRTLHLEGRKLRRAPHHLSPADRHAGRSACGLPIRLTPNAGSAL